MRYRAFATDYDGTLAHHGQVDEQTIIALRRLAAAGCKLILVTGRQWHDLQRVFPQVASFDRVVAENGALLVDPPTGRARELADPPPAELIHALEGGGVQPLYRGQVVLATVEPNEVVVRDVIEELGLNCDVILNKGSVMILPRGIDKASGLRAALDELGISAGDTVAVGDAENDQPLLELAGFGVAVANALDSLKQRATVVTNGDHGDGVRELIDTILEGA